MESAQTIPTDGYRDDFIARIQQAQKQPPIDPTTLFRDRPAVLWERVIPDWCNSTIVQGKEGKQAGEPKYNMDDNAVIAAAKGLRKNYHGQGIINPSLLLDIDRALCACARVKDKIVRLQCPTPPVKKSAAAVSVPAPIPLSPPAFHQKHSINQINKQH